MCVHKSGTITAKCVTSIIMLDYTFEIKYILFKALCLRDLK